MMKVRVLGGTPSSANLCKKCEYYRNLQYQKGDVLSYCAAFRIPLHDEVAECTSFETKGTKGLWELEKDAWILEVSKTRKIGFVSPLERKRRGDE